MSQTTSCLAVSLINVPTGKMIRRERISADVVGNTRAVLAAISEKFVRPTMLVILAYISVGLVVLC